MTDWFIVYTTSSGENRAKQDLEDAGFSVFLPIEVVTLRPARHRRDRRKRVVTRPLFPRYLFVGLKRGWYDFDAVLRSKRVYDFLRDCFDNPIMIHPSVVEGLVNDMSMGKFDDAQQRMAKEAARLKDLIIRCANNIKPGMVFRWQTGMFKDFEATVIRVREKEIRCEIKGANGASLSVDVPAAQAEEVGLLSSSTRGDSINGAR